MKNLNATEIKSLAKTLKIQNWWTKKRAELFTEIVELKGWTDHTHEVQEFLVAGGEIKKLPDAGIPPIKVPRESSATLITEENEKWKNRNKKRRTPKKAKSDKRVKSDKKAKEPADKSGLVTLSNICIELGVEGRIARRKLRNSDIKKPGTTWEWEKGHKDIDTIKALLK